MRRPPERAYAISGRTPYSVATVRHSSRIREEACDPTQPPTADATAQRSLRNHPRSAGAEWARRGALGQVGPIGTPGPYVRLGATGSSTCRPGRRAQPSDPGRYVLV